MRTTHPDKLVVVADLHPTESTFVLGRGLRLPSALVAIEMFIGIFMCDTNYRYDLCQMLRHRIPAFKQRSNISLPEMLWLGSM